MKKASKPVNRKVDSKKVKPRTVKKPVKRKKPVDHKIVRGLKQAVKHARRAHVVDIEPAIFDIAKPPAGMAYQWNHVSRTEYMLISGWSRVPYSRHPELPRTLSFDGYIRYFDNVLFQIDAEMAEAKLHGMRNKAAAQRDGVGGDDALEMLGEYVSARRRGGSQPFPILSPYFLVSSDYDGAPAGDAIVDVTIKFFMPWRWRDAAAALKLDEGEYVRRWLLMSGHFLAPNSELDWKNVTYSAVELTTEKVED